MKYKWYDQNDTSHLLGKLCFIGFLLHFKNKEYEWYNPNGTETLRHSWCNDVKILPMRQNGLNEWHDQENWYNSLSQAFPNKFVHPFPLNGFPEASKDSNT